MRRLPFLLAGIFIAITLTRVAALVEIGFSAGLLGWAFSLGLGVAVFVTSYFMRVSVAAKSGQEDRRSRNARVVSAVALIFFVAVDGYFNVVEVLRSLADPSLYIAALIYGAFPTVAAALLGVMQGYVDRLPTPPQKYNIALALRAWITTRIERKIDKDLLPAPDKPVEDPALVAKKAEFFAFVKKSRRDPRLAVVMLKFAVPVATASQWIEEYNAQSGPPL